MALDRLTKIDGGGISTTSDYRVGVITATKFVGPIEGTITSTDATFTGNVSIAGTLTYEDVTNVDSVGVITARNGIKVSTGTATTALVVDGDARVTGILTVGTSSLKLDGPNNVVNVGTALTLGHSQGVQFHTQNLHAQGFEINQINASGIITASQFKGDGSQLTGIDATALKDPAGNVKIQAQASGAVHTGIATFQDLDVDGHTNLDNVSIVGVTTIAHTGASQLIIKDSDTSGANSQQRISFRDSADTEVFFVGNNTTNSWLYLGSPSGQNNNIAFRVNGNDKFQVNGNGAYVNGALTVAGNADISDSIIHTGDTDTKIRFPGTDIFTVETAGTERVRVDSAGLKIEDKLLHMGDIDTAIRFPAADTVTVETGGSERLRIDSSGNIRQEKTGANVSLTLSRNESVGTTNQALGVIDFASNTAHTVQARVMAKSLGTANVGGDLIFETRASGGSLDERLRISGSGDITAVNTASGGQSVTLSAGASNASGMNDGIIKIVNGGTGNGVIQWDYEGNANRAQIYVYRSDQQLRFTTAGSERLRITTDKVMFSADAKVDTTNTRDLGANGAKWRTAYLGTQLNIDAASSTEMIVLDAGGTNFARIGHNTASGVAILDVRSEGHTRFLTNGNNERLRITSDGKILAANANSYHADADDLVLRERSGGNVGMTLQNNSNANVYGVIYFADTDAQHSGRIQYDHSNDSFDFFTDGSEKVSINSAGGLKLSNTPGGSLFEYGGSTVQSHAAININRYGNGYADIRLSSNYGASLRLAGASNNTDEYHITQDNQKNVYHRLEYDGLIDFDTNNTTRAMRLQSGKVAINKNIETLTGNGVNAKLQVNCGSNDYDGIVIGGGYNRSTITTGGTYDLVLTSNAYPANATSAGIRFKCGSSGGGGPNERMRLHESGVLKVYQGVDTQGNGGAYFYTPNTAGYQGTQWTEQGAGFVFYMGELVSGSSSNASTKYVTVYTSHHWGDYPRLCIWAHERYYRCSFTTWTFGAFGGSSPSYNLTQTESWGSSAGGHGTDNAGSISVNHRGPVATYSGSQVHAYELTMSNTGTYGYTRWYIGVLRGGRGIYTSASTVSNVDASTSSGGCVHLHTMSNAQMGAISYLTA